MKLTTQKLKQMILAEMQDIDAPEEAGSLEQDIQEVEQLVARGNSLFEQEEELLKSKINSRNREDVDRLHAARMKVVDELDKVVRMVREYGVKYDVPSLRSPEVILQAMKNKLQKILDKHIQACYEINRNNFKETNQ